MAGECVRELVAAGELELVAGSSQHRRRFAAECLRCGLGDRVQRLLLGERLAQHSCDPVEAALDLRLTRALLVRLGVAERDRGEARERLDQPQVRLLETAVLPGADTEDSADLAERVDRRVHHLGEVGVAAPGRRLLGRGEVAPQHRLPGRNRLADRAADGDRAPDLRLGQPEHCPADKLGSAREQGPAVRRVCVHEPTKLLDEALDHRVEVELARQRLACLEQRLLLRQPPVALPQQPGRVERDRGFAGDRLDETDLGRAPLAGDGTVEREHAEQPFLNDDRRREDRAHASLGELANVAGRVRAERGRVEHVCNRDGASGAGAEVRDGEMDVIADRRDLVGNPFRCDRPVALLAEPDEPAGGAERRTNLPEHDRQHLVDVPARAKLERDVRDQPLALERVGERDRRA